MGHAGPIYEMTTLLPNTVVDESVDQYFTQALLARHLMSQMTFTVK